MKLGVSKVCMLLGVLFLVGCGKAHIRADTDIANLQVYKNVYIADVVVTSEQEKPDLAALNEQTVIGAKRDLTQATQAAGGYNLVDSDAGQLPSSIVVNTRVDIVYGSRVKRYFIGFGSGKGGVTTTLTVTDSATGQVVYSLTSESDLSFGLTGGGMRETLSGNIEKLVSGYRAKL